MYLKHFIETFSSLGNVLETFLKEPSVYPEIQAAVSKSATHNSFFTPQMQLAALQAIRDNYLKDNLLFNWLSGSEGEIKERETEVTIVMAGNIPLVGFHDLLSVLAAGCKAAVKLSSKDRYLLPAIIKATPHQTMDVTGRVRFVDSIPPQSRIILAAGTDQTIGAIEENNAGSIILGRGTRFSMAIIHGDESDQDIKQLSSDMFLYYGLGCRSVSNLFIPGKYNISQLAAQLNENFPQPLPHDYSELLKYQKALMTMTGETFLDAGNFLMKECSYPSSPPVSVINYIPYHSVDSVSKIIINNSNKVQCVVNLRGSSNSVRPGRSQLPSLWEYADGINTLDFILKNS